MIPLSTCPLLKLWAWSPDTVRVAVDWALERGYDGMERVTPWVLGERGRINDRFGPLVRVNQYIHYSDYGTVDMRCAAVRRAFASDVDPAGWSLSFGSSFVAGYEDAARFDLQRRYYGIHPWPVDENGIETHEIDHHVIAFETEVEMVIDCAIFERENKQDLNRAYDKKDVVTVSWGEVQHGMDVLDAGSDFWMARNRQRQGFVDPRLHDVGKRLRRNAVEFGPFRLYIENFEPVPTEEIRQASRRARGVQPRGMQLPHAYQAAAWSNQPPRPPSPALIRHVEHGMEVSL